MTFEKTIKRVENYKKILKQTLNAIGINAPVNENTKN